MTKKRLIQAVLRHPPDGEGKLTTYLNLYSYSIARRFPDLFGSFDVIKLDGIALVVLLKMFGVRRRRASFDMTSDAANVFSQAQRAGLTVYLIGSEPGISSLAAEKITTQYPQLKIIGCREGYFRDEEDRELTLLQIAELAPDIVVCGMGTPFQERFLVDLQYHGYKGAGYTCGGFLHQTAKGGVGYYPKLFDKLNLRWLYRIFDEPKLVKRYFLYYPFSMVLFAADYVSQWARGKNNKNNKKQ